MRRSWRVVPGRYEVPGAAERKRGRVSESVTRHREYDSTKGCGGLRLGLIRPTRLACLPTSPVKCPFKHRLFWIAQSREDIFSDLFDQLLAPEWIAHIVVDNPDVLEVERHIVLVRGNKHDRLIESVR